ncbi:unnamed protein product [Miscanthus lutarioriparius]|uniref:Peptidyl-prolyl cis-trans isomerase n=1 Tax=Miscanthus lutarioriparius TaxID=422564 RepID=A0A811QR33_9POAL|nr:unnamed protein product [Miscanthus lutarioriparius]
MAAAAAKNPRVFFDVTIDGIQQDRIEMDHYKDEMPLVAENFRVFCTNEGNPRLSFKGSIFHRIILGFMCQGSEFRKSTGTGAGAGGRRFVPGVGGGGEGDLIPQVCTSIGVHGRGLSKMIDFPVTGEPCGSSSSAMAGNKASTQRLKDVLHVYLDPIDPSRCKIRVEFIVETEYFLRVHKAQFIGRYAVQSIAGLVFYSEKPLVMTQAAASLIRSAPFQLHLA